MMEFATLADLAHHLTRDTVGGLVATRKGLEVATAILQKGQGRVRPLSGHGRPVP
jgi:hypothetical protein